MAHIIPERTSLRTDFSSPGVTGGDSDDQGLLCVFCFFSGCKSR